MIAPALTFTLAVVANAHGLGNAQHFTAIAFTALSIIELLTTRLLTFLSVVPLVIGARGCVERIQEHLLKPDRFERESRGSAECDQSAIATETKFPIVIDHCSFSFSPDSAVILNDISLKIPAGQVTMIVGPVGSGKTALLRAIVGEMHKINGYIDVPTGQIALCQQSPWLQNRSIRENVLGTSPFDPEWYERVIYSCALDREIVDLAGEDDYIVGTNGATLSGGQKQRVVSLFKAILISCLAHAQQALARAVYSRKHIIVMDDTLSALDEATAQAISRRLLSDRGILRTLGTTVVFATNDGNNAPQ